MNRMTLFKRYCIVIGVLISVTSCNEWDEHTKPVEADLNKNLLQAIQETAALSTFYGYLQTTGYDLVLASSKTFTVWAPTNDALEGLDSDIVNDPQQLLQFVGNHISYQEYFTTTPKPTLRVKMANGKHLTWSSDNLEGASLVSANRYVRNGVLHIINDAIAPKLNNWEILSELQGAQKQASFLHSLTYQQFVPDQATQIGVDPFTGQPIYEEGTGIVVRNYFHDEVYNISNEDSLYTFIVLTDEAFVLERDSLKPFFKTVTMNEDSINRFASWHLTRDLVIPGVLSLDELPDTLISQFNVKIPIDKSAIVETHHTSNGIVYVMNKVDFVLKNKLPTIIIEGEEPTAFSRTDKNLNIHYRYKEWASQNLDLRVRDHGVALFNVRYRVNYVPSVTYKVYWRAVNDFAAVTHQQRLQVGTLASATFPYVTVNVNNLSEVYLGEFTPNKFGLIDLYLVAANSGAVAVNPLVLDYIKLVPQP